jgi:uncharacterized SAM-binding protein YcdF (DUF218 family)
VALCGIALFSWPPVAWLGSATLEWWYPVQANPTTEAEAIVVLAGYVAAPEPERPRAIVGRNTYVRCSHASWLYQNWSQRPVVPCGGQGASDAMAAVLRSQGVPDDMIWPERRSTRTYENAKYAAEILRAKGIDRVALVTDGYHMLRGDLCFRKQGIDVVPAPCSFRTSPFPLTVSQFLPGSTAIRQNEETLHEWIGIIWYRTKGWL